LFLPKSAAHRFSRETYDENVRAIRTCVNWFKRFKNGDFDIWQCSGRSAAVKEKLQKVGKKIVKNDGK